MLLPAHLNLQPPFPQVTLQAPQIESIAPGVEYGEYALWTDAGPIVVRVVAANLANRDVRVQMVLAHDVLTSQGETVSSMAERTGAIAGINGDYFDIGQTNRPTNVVVHDGTLELTPRNRYALEILTTGTAHFAELSFEGTVTAGTQSVPLTAINRRPSNPSDLTLITPAYGALPATPDVTYVPLVATTGNPPLATYRVNGDPYGTDESAPQGFYLAEGAAVASQDLFQSGASLAVSGTLSPIPLSEIAQAIGGGPLILYDGHWFDDPDGPKGGAFDHRVPCSGAALADDGTLLLVEVDGRQPQRSVGLTRPQFSSLMQALGASYGIAFDGGGSSTIAAQLAGDDEAMLQNSPSDGRERSVADGIFLYNASPAGPPARLAASPETLRAVPGARVPLRVDAVDANEHPSPLSAPLEASVEPARLGSVVDGSFVARSAGDGIIRLRSSSLTASVPVEVVATPARLMLLPENPNVEASGAVQLSARAFDDAGFALALPRRLPWQSQGGSIDPQGRFVAGAHNAEVQLDIGGRSVAMAVSVGNHEAPLDVLTGLHFLTFPAGGSGSAVADPSCPACLQLQYALGPSERAAYAVVERPLPAGTVGLSFDVRGDGSAVELRIALRNAIDEQTLVSAASLDRAGWQHVVVRFPQGLVQPLRLVGFYVLSPHPPAAVSGTVVVKDVHVLLAGSQ
jgi:exopolysaccharide biosynthesis protein